MLLSALNLLAAGDASLIQVLTSASVPSTLVKCLYLFFDLPEIPEDEADVNDGSEFTPKERRILLQKIFVQVCVQHNIVASKTIVQKLISTYAWFNILKFCI